MPGIQASPDRPWPPLPLADWLDTYETLHRCLQVVGKVQLALTPRSNHFWNAALRVGSRGLETPPIPWAGGSFNVDLDFIQHSLSVRTSAGDVEGFALQARSVAEFHRDFFALLRKLGVEVRIREEPVELQSESIPLDEDDRHRSYDRQAVERWWWMVAHTATLLERFRACFAGKCSPVNFWWGGFDLAVSRYSGRRAPARPDADVIQREAYSHETSAAGFWPGDRRYPAPAFFAYTAPVPAGLGDARVRPSEAFWSPLLGEHLLPYEAIRTAPRADEEVLAFFQSCYEAGATLAGWDRPELERAAEPAPTTKPAPGPAADPNRPA
jgi:hypothetical protein